MIQSLVFVSGSVRATGSAPGQLPLAQRAFANGTRIAAARASRASLATARRLKTPSRETRGAGAVTVAMSDCLLAELRSGHDVQEPFLSDDPQTPAVLHDAGRLVAAGDDADGLGDHRVRGDRVRVPGAAAVPGAHGRTDRHDLLARNVPDELAYVVVGRGAHDLLRGAQLHHLAVTHQGDALAQLERLA